MPLFRLRNARTWFVSTATRTPRPPTRAVSTRSTALPSSITSLEPKKSSTSMRTPMIHRISSCRDTSGPTFLPSKTQACSTPPRPQWSVMAIPTSVTRSSRSSIKRSWTALPITTPSHYATLSSIPIEMRATKMQTRLRTRGRPRAVDAPSSRLGLYSYWMAAHRLPGARPDANGPQEGLTHLFVSSFPPGPGSSIHDAAGRRHPPWSGILAQ